MVTKLVTDLKVSPKDWLTNPNSVKSTWQIWYRYKGKLVKIMRMNREKDYSSRVKLTLQIIKEEELKLHEYGFDPIEKTYQRTPNFINQEEVVTKTFLGFIDALNLAYSKLKIEHSTLIIVKSCIKYVAQSAVKVKIDNLPLEQVKKGHIKLLMNDCQEVRNLSARNYNAYRSYLMMLFEELKELELIDLNPIKELKKKSEIINLRKTLSPDERKRIKEHLSHYYPDFYRFIQIFFHSGSRRTELLTLKIKDVDLVEGEFTCLVKKGSKKRFVRRAIKDVVKHFWVQQLQGYPPGYYVFSKDLLPGEKKIREAQVTRRWRVHVKDKLGIKADLYSLKHLNTDETSALIGIEAASKHNGHTTTQVTKQHYAFGEQKREREKLKKVSNVF